jgi:hypothetical protein
MTDAPHEDRSSSQRPAVPFLAPRPGDVPRSGVPTVAGLQLPDGLARPDDGRAVYWRTDGPVAEPGQLTSPLARAFPTTGLWPLLYAWEEEPENFWFGGPGAPDAIPVDVETVMQSQWESWKQATWGPRPIFPEFPGLADAQPGGTEGEVGDPFTLVNDNARRNSWDPERWLLLVPCRRPADVLAVLGWDFSQMPYPIMTALLRSWEERFAAVPVEIDLATIVLNIGRPPQHRAQAERLVAEFAAVCEFEISEQVDDWLSRTTALLLPDSPVPPLADNLSPTHWRISFQEAPPSALFELVDSE